MVCVTETETLTCQVELEIEKSDDENSANKQKTNVNINPDATVSELIEKIQKIFLLDDSDFEIYQKSPCGKNLVSFLPNLYYF